MDIIQTTFQSYIREFSVGGIMRASIRIYLQNFFILFLITFVPIFLLLLILAVSYSITGASSFETLHLIYSVFSLICLYLSYPALVVAVSEISLGLKPTLRRSYKRIYEAGYGKYIYMLILQLLFLLLGFLLFFVGALVFSMWYLLVAPVFILENTSGQAALRRSKELGKGYYFRSFLIIMLMIVLFYSFAFLLAIVAAIVAGEQYEHPLFTEIFTLIFQILFYPLLTIPSILIYFDLRVRKEGYNIMSLSEDLQH